MNEIFTTQLETIDLPSSTVSELTTVPVLTVTISGTPGITDVVSMMKQIRKETDRIKTSYVSVTDLREVNIPTTLENILLAGFEKLYKHILQVSNPSLLSIVILKEGQTMSTKMKKILKDINDKSRNNMRPYNYAFISDPSKIPGLVRERVDALTLEKGELGKST